MTHRVLVIGGGMAGLATAVHLSAQGHSVTQVEQSGRLGGRLGSASPSGPDLPLIIFGWHDATHAFLDTLGSHDRLLAPTGTLEFHTPTRSSRLPRWWGPARIDTWLNVLTFRGLSGGDRLRLASWLERTWEGDPPLPPDLELRSGDRWLAETGQSLAARAEVWDPLARLLTGHAVTDVSAAVLSRTLAQTFLRGRGRAAWTLLDGSVEDILIAPARERLRHHGATVHLHTGAQRLSFDTQGVTGVHLTTGETVTADWYVLALPHRAVTALLPDHVLTHYAYFQQLTQLVDSPATVVHLRVDRPLLQPRLCLLAGRFFHWLLARPDDHRFPSATRLSLVQHSVSDLDRESDMDLLSQASEDIRFALPELEMTGPPEGVVNRQVAAWLRLAPGVTPLRPLQRSPFPNLLLAGDWTDTDLPPTLESALVSATRCADIIATGDRPDPRR